MITTPGIILLVLVLSVFIAMARRKIGPELGMPILALFSLTLTDMHHAQDALMSGFGEFAHIAFMFTAVAIAAAQMKKAKGLYWIGLAAGQLVGKVKLSWGIPLWVSVPTVCLSMTWGMAAVVHNSTSILIMAAIITTICEQYSLRALPILNGALVASNLGGFSSSWGDTPNIIEAQIWKLTQGDFGQILVINLGCLTILIAVVALLMKSDEQSLANVQVASQLLAQARRQTSVVGRYMALGIFGVLAVVVLPIIWPDWAMQIVAGSMVAMILILRVLERPDRRHNVFEALGFETYVMLAAVFVLAAALSSDAMGISAMLSAWLKDTHASVWSVCFISYLGTLFTEAASWANAASSIVYQFDTTHRAAWALGGGICAGSSSLVTAASAGILLLKQTEQNPTESRVTFASYWKFGICFSLLMLLYYTIVLNLFTV